MESKDLQLSAGILLEQQLARSLGLDKYAGILESSRAKDVSSDVVFQRMFVSVKSGTYRWF